MANCEKDKYLQFDTSVSSLRFVYPQIGQDSIIYSFGLHPGVDEDAIIIPFKLIGIPAPIEKEVLIEIVKEKTNAIEKEDFTIASCSLATDSINGHVEVYIKRMNERENVRKVITLRLHKNHYFTDAPINESEFRIILTDELAKPSGWIFDEYSRVKHEFIILHTGVAANYDQWSASEQIYWKGKLIKALYEYNKSHPGKPLTDENGLVVTF